jgi:serine/threonine protein kinase
MNFMFEKDGNLNGISLDTLTYSAMKTTSVNDAYHRAMETRCISDPQVLQLIDPQEIVLHRIIGEGTFGRVWSARLNSASVAVKEFVFAQAAVAGKSAQQDEIIEEIIGEAGMMAILRHPNVLQLFGCSLTAQAIWIVSELCSLGSLRHLLDDEEKELPLETRLKIALQVAEGMVYLHNQEPKIIHRDLKSHNIMVHETYVGKTGEGQRTIKASEVSKIKSTGTSKTDALPYRSDHSDRSLKMHSEATIIAKIGDWGSARATFSGTRTMTHGVGTSCWLAPEVIKHARSSQYSDVYSFGIILWEIATRSEVYGDLEGTQIIAQVANDGLRPPVPENNPLSDLMVKCWCENPEDRLSFKEIVKELNNILSDLPEDQTSPNISPQTSFSNTTSYQNSIAE